MGEKEFYTPGEILEFLAQNDEELFLGQNKRFMQSICAFIKQSDIKEIYTPKSSKSSFATSPQVRVFFGGKRLIFL